MKSKKKNNGKGRAGFPSIFDSLAVAAKTTRRFIPLRYRFNRSLIEKNTGYNVGKIDGEYTSLAKKDAFGNLTDDNFKIIAFTDMHLDNNRAKSDVTIEMFIKNISLQKPDLVVLVGDNITSVVSAGRVKQFGKLMEDLGVYWTFAFGNHEGDNAASISRKKMLDILASYPHCLVENDIKKTKSGETVWGVGNHVINILGSKGEIRQSLYFIDCGDEMTEEDLEKYKEEIESTNNRKDDYIKDSQIQWYKETVGDINEKAGKMVKSIIFCHIPLVEFNTAYEKAMAGNTKAELLYGTRLERVCSSGHNNGFFDIIRDLGSTQAFISGHDHVNDYAVRYEGVILAYNQSSGYSAYNVVTKKISDTLIQGFTIYSIDKDGGLTIKPYRNSDLYPELQEDILKLYK